MFRVPCVVLFVLLKCAITVRLDENSTCGGLRCQKTVTMPLLDKMEGNLKADFDVSEMNKLLKVYIDQQIRSGVEIGLQQVKKEIASVDFKMTKLKQDTDKELNDELKVSKKYAFFATLSSDRNNLPRNAVVMFDTVSLNEGDAYDGTTGTFTCPEDGLYHFSWTAVSGRSKDFVSVLVANDRKIAANAVDSDSVSDSMTGTSNVIVRMMKGQKAWVAVHREDGKQLVKAWNGSPCSMFSGFKL
ncbi:Hypothetical predicted protein [Mytilus galloprovincialis]|uniref:C1q domain-containing protein n=1 Tax=Mytilus galloprovincialis TaxID=29158 RepID=A0A8B6FZW1_MYTGA|nr:Hypothetical predicted protein [Mytilus galloprovincialis]